MIRTERLVLRAWREEDLPAYAALNADPEVRRFFPATLTRAESDAQAARLQAHVEEHGFGFWAVEARGVLDQARSSQPQLGKSPPPSMRKAF